MTIGLLNTEGFQNLKTISATSRVFVKKNNPKTPLEKKQ